jgi:Zn-dependent alcohol dehydrogenase
VIACVSLEEINTVIEQMRAGTSIRSVIIF